MSSGTANAVGAQESRQFGFSERRLSALQLRSELFEVVGHLVAYLANDDEGDERATNSVAFEVEG